MLLIGVASFGGNTFYERCLLFITEKRLRGARKLPFTLADARRSKVRCGEKEFEDGKCRVAFS